MRKVGALLLLVFLSLPLFSEAQSSEDVPSRILILRAKTLLMALESSLKQREEDLTTREQNLTERETAYSTEKRLLSTEKQILQQERESLTKERESLETEKADLKVRQADLQARETRLTEREQAQLLTLTSLDELESTLTKLSKDLATSNAWATGGLIASGVFLVAFILAVIF